MKILIIGGGGAQARPAIERLVAGTVFSEIVIADINKPLVEKLVRELDSLKVSARRLDAFDHEDMVAAMADSNVVMKCSGPYHLLGVRVLRAAIEVGAHFVDYCDDVTPTLEMLELSAEAKARGVTAIIGLGVSPGYFNLLAVEAAGRLDSADEINMYWSIAKGEPEGPAVIDHMLDIMSGEVLQFIDGKEVVVPALSGIGQEIDMPAPFGRLPAAFVGHPEPVTLSRYIPGLRQVINKYAAPLEELGLYQALQELGLMRKEPIVVRDQQVSPRDVLVTLLASAPHEAQPGEALKSAAVLEVSGKKGGVDTTIRYHLKGNMAPLTSLPAALGAELLARGEVTETGVMPPEACVPPKAVLQPMAESGLVDMLEQVIPERK